VGTNASSCTTGRSRTGPVIWIGTDVHRHSSDDCCRHCRFLQPYSSGVSGILRSSSGWVSGWYSSCSATRYCWRGARVAVIFPAVHWSRRLSHCYVLAIVSASLSQGHLPDSQKHAIILPSDGMVPPEMHQDRLQNISTVICIRSLNWTRDLIHTCIRLLIADCLMLEMPHTVHALHLPFSDVRYSLDASSNVIYFLFLWLMWSVVYGIWNKQMQMLLLHVHRVRSRKFSKTQPKRCWTGKVQDQTCTNTSSATSQEVWPEFSRHG